MWGQGLWFGRRIFQAEGTGRATPWLGLISKEKAHNATANEEGALGWRWGLRDGKAGPSTSHSEWGGESWYILGRDRDDADILNHVPPCSAGRLHNGPMIPRNCLCHFVWVSKRSRHEVRVSRFLIDSRWPPPPLTPARLLSPLLWVIQGRPSPWQPGETFRFLCFYPLPGSRKTDIFLNYSLWWIKFQYLFISVVEVYGLQISRKFY